MALLAAVGCQDNLQLPALPFGAARSGLFLIDGPDQRLAFGVEPGSAAPTLRLEPGTRLLLGTYDQPLSDLGLFPGPLALDRAEAPVAPTPETEYALLDPYDSWGESNIRDALWAELKVERVVDGCLDLEAVQQHVEIVPGSAVAARCWTTAPPGSLRTLFGNTAGVWSLSSFELSHVWDPITSTASISPSKTSTTPVLAAFVGADDRLYLYQRGGRLWAMERGERFTLLGTAPGAGSSESAWMAGPQTSVVEVYVMDSAGGIWGWDEASGLRTILAPGQGRPFPKEGGLVWIDQGALLALGPRNASVLHIRDGRIEPITLPPAVVPTALTATRRHGVLLGDMAGQLYRFDGEGFQPLLGAPRAIGLWTILEVAGGLLYGPTSGQLRYFREDRPECTGELRVERAPFGSLDFGTSAIVLTSSGIFGDAGPIRVTELSWP